MGTMFALVWVRSAFVGCANDPLTNKKNDPLDLGGSNVTWVVEMETYADSVSNDQGYKVAEYSYTVPVLYPVRSDGSRIEKAATDTEARCLEIAAAFSEPFSTWTGESENCKEFLAFAQESQSGPEIFPYTDELTCTVYQTTHLISVYGVYYSFAGGAHPNTFLYSWNFDLETGSFFDPQILEQGSALGAAVHDELLRQAKQKAAEEGMKPEDYFWTNYDEILTDWGSYAVSFDEEGMMVAFSPYELACYAAGEQIFHISYEWLSPRLSPEARQFLDLGNESN